jgi:kynurenine formamidase
MKILDLTQPLGEATPIPGMLEPGIRVQQYKNIKDDGVSVQIFQFPSHSGTHVDAPSHFIAGGLSAEAIPLEWLCRAAVIADLPRGAGETVTGDDLETAVGSRVRAGDLLFVRTGKGAEYAHPATYLDAPYFTPDAARWIVERELRGLGVDILTPEVPHARRSDGYDYEVHRILLGAEVIIIENLNLEPVVPYERLPVQVLPLPISSGDGAQARAIAHVS